MNIPTLDQAITILREIVEDESIDSSARIGDLEIDSLDLLEWALAIGEEVDRQLDIDPQDIDADMTLAEIYDKVLASAVAA